MIGITLLTLVSFTVATYEVKKATAEVEQIDGYYIFINSKPVMDFDYMGTVKEHTVSIAYSDVTEIRDKLLRRVKKLYPNADALIFTFKDGQKEKVDAVKFK
jgi:hypothetical protein